MVFREVLSEKVVILHSPEDFPRYADSNMRGVLLLFMPASEITEEADFILETPYVESMCMLKVHMVKSFKKKAGFYYLQFFKIATDDNPFYTHWYCQPGDLTDPCGHMDLPVHYAVNVNVCKKRVQVVFKAKQILLGHVVHYVHNGTMTNAMITNFVILLFIHYTL